MYYKCSLGRLHYLDIRCELVDFMIIFDISNGFIICSEILALINFRIPRKHTRDLIYLTFRFTKQTLVQIHSSLGFFFQSILLLLHLIFFGKSRRSFTT
jgi:hypothetical protein